MRNFLMNYFQSMLPIKLLFGEAEYERQVVALINTLLPNSDRITLSIIRKYSSVKDIVDAITIMIEAKAA